MTRIIAVLVCILVPLSPLNATAASDKAESLRKAYALTPFSPPDAFLAGNFLADEREPAFLFGTVKDFAASRSCPVSWLIEEPEKTRVDKGSQPDKPLEYTLYLEEDCPGGVAYYVFTDQSAMTPAQWIEWRRQFHKNKAEGEYGATRDRLEKAVAEGLKVSGELRFIMKDGELSCDLTPEESLSRELSFKPCYDLKQGARMAK